MHKKVYWIEGDGIGPEVWRAARPVIDAAVNRAYGDTRSLIWEELLAGEKAQREVGEHLPQSTLNTLQQAELAMKGPLGTPVGKGFRSLNVTLRQSLDLYACIRPVRHVGGLETPVKHPERVNMVIFRENTEDVYAGIEYAAESPEARKLIDFLHSLGAKVDPKAAIGIKPMTEAGSRRLTRRAFNYALDQGLPSVTLVHKGNIMKYTEGGFRQWGYALAEDEFAGRCCLEKDAASVQKGQIIVKDRIADAMFQEVLLRPEQYSVVATSNLNGDYLSDALAAQVGGLGLAPGVNMSDTLAFFEATHGTAPSIAGKDLANPGSLVLCGALMLEHMGWHEAGHKVRTALDAVLASRRVTVDIVQEMPGATQVGCREFGDLLLAALV